MVFDNSQVDYRKDDGGNQDDSRINPFNHDFLKMELRHPYCTPGVYNMSSQEFTDSNLNVMSHWHTCINRFALTSTVNLTDKDTSVRNDREWLAFKASRSEYARLDAPVPPKLDLPALLQKKNAPDADERESRNVQWQSLSNSSANSSSSNFVVAPDFLNQGTYSFQHTPVKPAHYTPGLNTYPGGTKTYAAGGT